MTDLQPWSFDVNPKLSDDVTLRRVSLEPRRVRFERHVHFIDRNGDKDDVVEHGPAFEPTDAQWEAAR